MSNKVVTRREIRSLSESETNRFFDAVDKMMENKSGPGTSEFYRLASYHGRPGTVYCQHGEETFPGWHRIYLFEFEKALQAADKALGNDGNIAVHYWDWTQNPEDGLPKVIRDRFSGWPEEFWPEAIKNHKDIQQLKRASDQTITGQLKGMKVAKDAIGCLSVSQHCYHASTRFKPYGSIETPHNKIHEIVGANGGTMSGVAWAAYDITFWLHHSFIDRIYESYLVIEPDSQQEFENFQKNFYMGKVSNQYEREYQPFKKSDGSFYSAVDTFDTKALGFEYDSLLKAPPQHLREPPTFILFSQVKISDFESKCYQIHAFVIDGDKEDDFKEPVTLEDIDYDSPNYAGGDAIFGRGTECENCVSRPPQDIAIEITETLRTLAINRYSAKAKIYLLETTEDSNVLQPVSDTPLPEPSIVGPLFANTKGDELLDQEDTATNDAKEVEALQKFLQKFGYYAPEMKIDGDYGDYTKQAVIDYQNATGNLEVDGIAGPLTRGAIVSNKRCYNADPFAKNDVVDKDVEGINFETKDVKYSIGVQPGYLKRGDVESAIKKAADQYTNCSALSLSQVENREEADIHFSWAMFNREDDPLRFDGFGGVLGRGGNGFVEFDIAERWVLGMNGDEDDLSDLFDPKTWYRGQPTISLYYTALHELGHALGLVHSMKPHFDLIFFGGNWSSSAQVYHGTNH